MPIPSYPPHLVLPLLNTHNPRHRIAESPATRNSIGSNSKASNPPRASRERPERGGIGKSWTRRDRFRMWFCQTVVQSYCTTLLSIACVYKFSKSCVVSWCFMCFMMFIYGWCTCIQGWHGNTALHLGLLWLVNNIEKVLGHLFFALVTPSVIEFLLNLHSFELTSSLTNVNWHWPTPQNTTI